MVSEIDIWRAANLLIKQHGESAASYAERHADEMLRRGDVDGSAVWCRIFAAIEELSAGGKMQH